MIPRITFSLLVLIATSLPAAAITSKKTGVAIDLNEQDGSYVVSSTTPTWRFGGSLGAAPTNVKTSRASDAVGAYQQLAFDFRDGAHPMSAQIRVYDEKPLVLFTDTSREARPAPVAPFPSFARLPPGLHRFGYRFQNFAPPQFGKLEEISTPWMLFDDQANAMIISPANHFAVAAMKGDGVGEISSSLNRHLAEIPAGFAHQTIVAISPGINRTWELWGRALTDLQGKKRPTNTADDSLKYLGYWTDNGATYYYRYDADKGYAGTLVALIEHYREQHIPIRYLQLDSWWYAKCLTDPEGKVTATKNAKLPEGRWNRYGGLLDYTADKDLFPDGLAAFQKKVGLPLVTHNRWIDVQSPYRQKHAISGVAAVDPKFWDDVADYLHRNGVVTYEQDWLDRIYNYSPELSSTIDAADRCFDNMSRACGERGITMQYCMPLPLNLLEGSKYSNLTTSRTSDDRFGRNRWNNFLYTARFASAIGAWPWADVFMSTEEDNLLLATLSAGPVGIGDAIAKESRANLMRSVRADGVIVKPDAAIVPTDASYLADAREFGAEPLVAFTYTDHGGVRTTYAFAYARQSTNGKTRFRPSDLGHAGPVYVYDAGKKIATRVDAASEFAADLDDHGNAFFVIAPVTKSGIAFLGDRDKSVGTGRARVAAITDTADALTADVVLSDAESTMTLHGYAPSAPIVSVTGATAAPPEYDAATQHFAVRLTVDPSAPARDENGDPVRHFKVTFKVAR